MTTTDTGTPAATPSPPQTPLTVDDIAQWAATELEPEVWDFVCGGAGDESTLQLNRTDLANIRLVPRVLRDVAHPSTHTTLLGTPAAMPVAVAPMAYQRLIHPHGELAVARACKRAGIPFTVSALTSTPIDQLAATGATLWAQLYWFTDRARVGELLTQAEQAGCRAVVLSVDMPRMGRRLRDIRNDFTLPAGLASGADAAGLAAAGTRPGSSIARHTDTIMDAQLNWDDIEWLSRQTVLPVVLKGILDARDAALAAEFGVDAIVVSNHGGRQFDGAPSTIGALPAVLDAVADRCPVLIDSGFRSGLDILRAMALGAGGVLLGRPILYGLVGGERGVELTLSVLREELLDAMTHTGCADLRAAADLASVISEGLLPAPAALT
ncbi:alpha-hydroxy acid oxidase [Sphaerisporangium flaviroseum]|uniref:Alpha-hydroxy acid oxidase n=1 Tax=Sphaerisporangium flaviroseum TaxID=509199 RepID=A0ABP7J147_9ACTN